MIKLDKIFSPATAIVIMLLLIVGLVVLGPILTLWALNTLFGLTLEYSLTNWVAVVIMHAFFSTVITTRNNSK
jgi:hypothetical protein